MKVAVIGAGIVGSAVARELARRGAAVTLFEQTAPGAGTSGTTFAWVNAHDKWPEAYHRLNLAGCAEHQRWAESADGPAGWYARTGNLEWADAAGSKRLEERFARLSAAGHACHWIDEDEARRLEPDLRLDGSVERVAYFPEEAFVLPVALLARLLGEARDHGAVLRCPARVTAVEPTGSGADVVLASGERERYDRVVSCVGRWTEEFAPATTRVPLVDTTEVGGAAVGFLAYTAPAPVRLSRVLTTPRLNVRPDGGGRLVLQGLDLDGTADPADVPAADSDLAAQLANRLHEVLGVSGPVAVESVRVGQRAMPADGLTVAGSVGESVYVVATHSGITLGPLLGRLVSSEVLGGDESALLGGFRPERFAEGPVDDTYVRAARTPGEQ